MKHQVNARVQSRQCEETKMILNKNNDKNPKVRDPQRAEFLTLTYSIKNQDIVQDRLEVHKQKSYKPRISHVANSSFKNKDIFMSRL